MPHVAVLGGGIAGLAAAHRLQELARERGCSVRVSVLEANEKAGGCIRTVRENGFVMELGADSMLAQKPAARSLLARLGLESEIAGIRPENRGARLACNGRLRPIPADFRLFAPRSSAALMRSGIFSVRGTMRAALEPLVPRRRSQSDESLASFVTRRFGREVLERLAQPIVGGIYSGDPSRLSMQMILPQFLEYERQCGSVLRGLHLAAAAAADPPALVSLRGGLSTLVDALTERLTGSIYPRTRAVGLKFDLPHGWNVGIETGPALAVDAVICAVPAPEAAILLAGVDKIMSDSLGGIRCNAIATVNLQHDAAVDRTLPAATGFVVPFAQKRAITAATFSSKKYAGRAPEGGALIRAFAGGALQPDLPSLASDELVALASRDLRSLAGVVNEPKRSLVYRWRGALPEYAVGHAQRVSEIFERTRQIDGLALAGCAYRGVGIPDCIASGEAAAESVFGYIFAA